MQSKLIYLIPMLGLLGCQSLFYSADSRNLTSDSGAIKLNVVEETPWFGHNDKFTYHWLKQNTIHTTEGASAGVLLHDKYQEFDLTGNLMIQGEFEFGLKTGTWKYWLPTGELTKIENYRKGLLHGEFTEYNSRGRSVENYKMGIKHGESYTLLNDGTQINRIDFKKGKKVVAPVPQKDSTMSSQVRLQGNYN